MVAGQARVDTVAVGDRTTGELRKQRHRLRGDAVVAAPALAGPTKGCAVLKVTLKGLLAHRARLVLTAVAVLIGVALVAGTLMLTDTIGQSVRHLTATAHAGVDVAVRNADDPKAGPPQAIGPQLLAAIRAVPGVGAAAGVVVAEKLQMVGRDGRPIRHQRAVNLVTRWPDDTVLVASRTREVALLRLLGATRRQVFGSVLGEAAVVGLVAAAGGVAAGAGAAVGLKALLRGLGNTLPPAGLVLAPRTVLVGLGVGALVTVAAALAPARRASQVALLQAIREAASSATMPAGRLPTAIGLALAALGAAAIAAGLALHVQSTVVAGLGALAVLVGLMALGPVLAPLLARVVGLPVTRLAGLAARLGRDNVLRNPRRSAATMGALAVGLVLAAGTGVLAASATRSVNAGIQAASNADLYLEGGLPLPAVARLVALPEVGAALPLDTGHVRVGGARIGMEGVDPMAAARMLKLGIRAGSVRALGRPGGGLLVSARLADNHGWHLGSIVPVGFTEVGATRQLPVVGVFDADRLVGSEVSLAINLGERYFPLNRGMADPMMLRAAPGISPAALQTAVQTVLASHPQVTVRDGIAYQRERAGDLGDLGGALGLLTALVLLAVGIATLGIANTLALAVFERTREFGLLRAVGMPARQLAAMVCWESAIIAVSGALLGTTLGAGLGAALASAITVQQAGVATIVLPARQLLVDLALPSTAGLIAATVPARRAARLNLLTAISAE